MLILRPMTEQDLAFVEAWLRHPHVARWWTPDTTPAEEITKYRERINATEPNTTMLIVTEGDASIGWCQWYRWADYPAEAAAMEARDGEIGIDYAIGDPSAIGRGVGTELIAALVAEVLRLHPGAGVLVDPDATNRASCRVLEKNDFELVAIRAVATEPSDAPMAIYRRPATPG